MTIAVFVRMGLVLFSIVVGGSVFAEPARNADRPAEIDHQYCSKQYASKNCSGRQACDELRKERRQCEIRLQAALDQRKARIEADYKASKKKELEAMARVNEALSKTQKLNGSKH